MNRHERESLDRHIVGAFDWEPEAETDDDDDDDDDDDGSECPTCLLPWAECECEDDFRDDLDDDDGGTDDAA